MLVSPSSVEEVTLAGLDIIVLNQTKTRLTERPTLTM